MNSIESKVLGLWQKTYQQHVNERILTKLEAYAMMANDLYLDITIIYNILEKEDLKFVA